LKKNLIIFPPKLKVITSQQSLMFRTNPVLYPEKRRRNGGFAKIILKITQTHVVQFLNKTSKHHLKKHMML